MNIYRSYKIMTKTVKQDELIYDIDGQILTIDSKTCDKLYIFNRAFNLSVVIGVITGKVLANPNYDAYIQLTIMVCSWIVCMGAVLLVLNIYLNGILKKQNLIRKEIENDTN